MSKNKTNRSTCVVKDKKGNIICYLDAKDEENGVDIEYDLKGYIVEAI